MTDDYSSESKFLLKNYRVFLFEYLKAFKTGTDSMHIHPPPAFRRLYELMIERYVVSGLVEIDTKELIFMMDMVAKFTSYLNRNEIKYDNFAECPCTRLSDEDLIALLESGGENR